MTNIVLILTALSLMIACDNSSAPNEIGTNLSAATLPEDYIGNDIDPTFIKSELTGNTDITDSEKEGLIYMREEEKLARDVYKFYSEKFGSRIFSNITLSEERHMNAVKILLDQFDIEDPIKEEGLFSDSELQDLYNKLTDITDNNLEKAIYNGLLIEDLDIRDLEKLISETTNPDIKFVYENLMRASGNHLRAFYRQAENYGLEYIPTYISKERFDEIISTSSQRGKGRRWRGGRKN